MASVFASGEAAGAVDGRYNILLLGGDSGAGRVGLRPDSIQLASVDAETGRAVLFGFSRETENIRFRAGVGHGRADAGGLDLRRRVPAQRPLHLGHRPREASSPRGTKDPGLLATTEAVEALTGLDIQYYVLVDLKGFRSLVDAVGGLDIAVQRRTPIGSQGPRSRAGSRPGNQHLDGYHALWYARSRANSTNYERMARQRCVVTAMVSQLDPQTVVLNFADIVAGHQGRVPHRHPAGGARQPRRPRREDQAAEDHLGQLRAAAHQALGLRPGEGSGHRGRRHRGIRGRRGRGGRLGDDRGVGTRGHGVAARRGAHADTEHPCGDGAPGKRPRREHG